MNISSRIAARATNGKPRLISWARKPPPTEPMSVPTPPTTWARPRTASSWPCIRSPLSASTSHASVAPEKNVKPRPSRRDDRPRPERRVDVPEHHVEGGRHGQGHRAEQERDAPAPHVRDDAGRDLEDHHAGGEERVGRERLEVVQAGIEQEDRVDPPDQRRREGVAEHQRVVRAFDGGGRVGHRHLAYEGDLRVNSGRAPADFGPPGPSQFLATVSSPDHALVGRVANL